MYKLEIFCNPDQQMLVQNVLHESGVDKIGNYDHCWAIGSVTGSHRALEGSNPVFGLKVRSKTTSYLKLKSTSQQNK